MKTLLTVGEVAKMFNVCEKTIYNKIYRGNIPYFKIGTMIRIDPEEIQKYLSSRHIKAFKTSIT